MRIAKFTAIGLLLAALLTVALVWQGTRGSIGALPSPSIVVSERRSAKDFLRDRHVEHVVLVSETLGEIGFTVSLPLPTPNKKMPIVFVFGGARSGEVNIRPIEAPGPNVIVGYDWPMPVYFPDGMALLNDAPFLYKRLMAIPAQATTILHWLSQQPWTDAERISLLGYSLGALAVPAVQRMAQEDGINIRSTILAYGGAPLYELFRANPHVRPPWARKIMALVIGTALRPMEPLGHLPFLRGRFLVLEGQDDELIPALARRRFQEAVPEPKTLVVLPGDHMGLGQGKEALLRQIVDTSRFWLKETGAVDTTEP